NSLNSLESVRNGKSKAETAVNAGFKHTNGKGYVEAALDHGKKLDGDIAKFSKNLKPGDANSLAKAQEIVNSGKNSEEFRAMDSSNQEIVKEKVFPRILLRGKLAEGTQTEKD